MDKFCLLTLAVSWILVSACAASAEEGAFEYPCYLLDAYDADGSCWEGMGVHNLSDWPVPVVPEEWLVGPPPAEFSAVTLPTDHWVELKFCGRLVDGPGDDILIIEWGTVGEQALVFITDGAGQDYLIGMGMVGVSNQQIPTEINFNMPDVSLPFTPSVIRVLGVTMGGGVPGFDLGSIRVRTVTDCCDIANYPIPADGVEDVPADAVLGWSPGCFADKHSVYFGTGLNDVDMNTAPVNPQPQDANYFDPCGLELGEHYYWRIDEINDPCVWTGNIWSFTVTDCCILDDFEFYNDTYNLIYNTWIESGATYLAFSENISHSCEQSMMFYYYCYDYSDAGVTRTFSPAQDWASIGARVLELYFYGTTTNKARGQMYIILNDGSADTLVLYEGDANDLKEETWHPWRIDLQGLNDVNLACIESITIGFTIAMTESYSWDEGTVYFDDVRVCSSRCLQENRPAADFSGDCAVDFEDLQELAYSWLNKGYNIYPVAAPNEPLAWYEFEDNADDSSANGYHGDPCGSPEYVTGVYGSAISFDGYEDSVAITDAAELFGEISAGITIAFWQYGEDSPHLNDTVCCSNYAYDANGYARPIIEAPALAINLGCWRSPGRYNWDCGYPWSFDNRLSGSHRYKGEWSGQWNHWAFTKDFNTGTMQIFLNGLVCDSRTGASSFISEITSFQIGSGWYGGYDGLIDDFRIYDYVLSQPEVAYAATNGTGIFDIPLMSPADLYADDLINFRDFAILADNWLEEHLWP